MGDFEKLEVDFAKEMTLADSLQLTKAVDEEGEKVEEKEEVEEKKEVEEEGHFWRED